MNPELPPEEPLGCLGTIQSLGMAFYAILLLIIMCSGTMCAMGSMIALTLPEDPLASGLMAGHQAGAHRLDQLREIGVLPTEGTPPVFYDGSSLSDGSSGCLFIDGTLVGWQLWAETGRVQVPGATITTIGRSVTVALGTTKVTCAFTQTDAAGKFSRMMTAEAAR